MSVAARPPAYQRLYARKVAAYRWLYEFTKGQCDDCSLTDCACKDSICAHVESQALREGVEFERPGRHRLRFLGCEGCVVPPHHRETCTIYLCTKAQQRPDFPVERYERLKALCARIDGKLMELE